MPMRLLKVKSTIPWQLENRLVNHWGFAVEKRIYMPENYVLLKKSYISDKKADDDAGVQRTIRAAVQDNIVSPNFKPEGLSKWQIKQLEKRCDNIVNFFPDPYSVPKAVRARLTIIQQHLTPAEAKFVEEYAEENFPV